GEEDREIEIENQLGALVRYSLSNPDYIQLALTTATFFRGDRVPIIPETAQFTRYDLSYEEYFEGCRFLRTFSYDFVLYGSCFIDPLRQLFTQKIGTTIVYIPSVNSSPTLGDKAADVMGVLKAIAGTDTPVLSDVDQPIMRVRRGQKWIKVVNLVDETIRDKKLAVIHDAH